MTTLSSIITAAYRESNLVAIVSTPSTLEQAEALSLLNSIILSVVGNEVGQELSDLMIDGEFDQSEVVSDWCPENVRLICNLNGGRTVSLMPNPYEGQRVAVVDAKGNFSTSNLVLDANGRKIEGAATLTLTTNSTASQWLYRADTANWTKITSLLSSDQMPFPVEFDDYFITRLAMRLNPRHGRNLAPETAQALVRAEQQIAARYRRPREQQDLGTFGLLGQRYTRLSSFSGGA